MLSNIWTWIKQKYFDFEAFLVRTAPGVKTKITTFLGMVGSAAAALQNYVMGVPVNKFVTAEQISIAAFILFTLAFWFKDMGSRVAVREELLPQDQGLTSNA